MLTLLVVQCGTFQRLSLGPPQPPAVRGRWRGSLGVRTAAVGFAGTWWEAPHGGDFFPWCKNFRNSQVGVVGSPHRPLPWPVAWLLSSGLVLAASQTGGGAEGESTRFLLGRLPVSTIQQSWSHGRTYKEAARVPLGPSAG